MLIFHRLFVDTDETTAQEGEATEDIFARVQKIFETYNLDPLYYHLNLVFEFLHLEYYNHYKVYRQAEKHYEEINDATSTLLVNYPNYTFSARFLISKIERALRNNAEKTLFSENEDLLIDIEAETQDVPKHVIYVCYQAISCYYAGKFDQAAKVINAMLIEVSLKKYPFVQMEVKALLALQYCMLKDFELFTQLTNSIQRQIRMFGKDDCENVLLFLKILRVATSEAKKEKAKKISAIIPKFKEVRVNYFAPTALIKMDEEFVEALAAIEGAVDA
jgi:hypothetical protein